MCSSDEIRDSIKELSSKLDEHVSKFESHEEEELTRHNLYVEGQRKNLEAIKDLAEKTHGMVEAWEAAEGVIRVGSALGRFVKWVSGFAILGSVVHWLNSKGI